MTPEIRSRLAEECRLGLVQYVRSHPHATNGDLIGLYAAAFWHGIAAYTAPADREHVQRELARIARKEGINP